MDWERVLDDDDKFGEVLDGGRGEGERAKQRGMITREVTQYCLIKYSDSVDIEPIIYGNEPSGVYH